MDTPSWVSISEGEEVILPATHPSRWVLAKDIFIAFVLIAAAFWVVIAEPVPVSEYELNGLSGTVLVPLLAILAGVGLVAVEQLKRITTVYLITSRKVWFKTGIYQREDVDPIYVEEIANVKWNQNIIQRLVGKGDVRVKTAATGNEEMVLEFKHIPDPKGAYEKLDQARQAQKQQAVEQRVEYEQQANASQQKQRDSGNSSQDSLF